MKNHWLDKKIDKEIDAAFAEIEFKDTDFIDLSTVMNKNSYKEYDRPVVYDINTSTDQEDRDMIKAIMLKNMHKIHWMEEVLSDVQYVPHLAPGCDIGIGNLTLNCGYGISTTMSDNVPGGDGIILNDNGGFPKDDEFSKQAGCCGDFACNCSANLDIYYPENSFIQNETLQVYSDYSSDYTQYQTMYTPVIAATMTGTIYPTPGNTSYGFVFYVSSDGKFTFDRFVQADGNVEYASQQPRLSDEEYLNAMANGTIDDKFIGWYDEAYVEGTTLNLQTGILELHYHMGKRPEIIVSYEYQREGSL